MEALYRRWRSQTFSDLVGQEHIATTLQGQIREGRIAHAYLFSGPRGTGKTSTARILAKALNCDDGPTPEPCNKCEACRAITAGSSLDVIEIDAASHGGVDDVRELRENVLLAPAVSRRKVYIVDEAHMVTTQGWNAFLKTIEEPPAHVMFVFATTEPEKVVPTIKSRCQRFDFRRVPGDEIATHLAKICAEEGFEADEAALSIIARHADGGMRDAISALDQLASSGAVTADRAAALLGSAPTETLFGFGDAIAARDAAGALRVIARLVEEGHDLRAFTRQVLEHFRALLFVQRVPDGGHLIDATDETRARLGSQAERFGSAALVHSLRLLAEAQAEMRQQAPPRLSLELAIVRAAMPEADASTEGLLSRIERLERLLDVGRAPAEATEEPAKTQSAPQQAVPQKPAPRAAKPSKPAEPVVSEDDAPIVPAAHVDFDKVSRDWPVVLEEVRKRSKRVHAMLQVARPVSYDAGELMLSSPHQFHASQLPEPKNAVVIAEAFKTVFGGGVRIRCEVGESAPAPEPPPLPATESSAPASDDPLSALVEGLGGEVIDQAEE